MTTTTEISALLHLMDDPDEEVFEQVSKKITNYGSPIIPTLESYWESIQDNLAQERIEAIIHKLQFSSLQGEFRTWKLFYETDLIHAAVLFCKYEYPNLDVKNLMDEIEKLKKCIWLEVNHTHTALEKINVINAILFKHFKFQSVANTEKNIPAFFYIIYLAKKLVIIFYLPLFTKIYAASLIFTLLLSNFLRK